MPDIPTLSNSIALHTSDVVEAIDHEDPIGSGEIQVEIHFYSM
jgi:hypothetical protein